tara:strand:- start:69 stop:818 length:750 start_codon:yes stop_codon:yes gene_type:complete
MKINFKQVFIFIIVGLLASACENDNSVGPEDHTDADGLVLEHDGQEVYKEFEGAIVFNNLTLNVGETLELSVHFLDHDGNEIEHEDEDEGSESEHEDELQITDENGDIFSSSNIVTIEVEEHCDEISSQTDCNTSEHCAWDATTNMCEEEHCDEISSQTDCEASEHCAWMSMGGTEHCMDSAEEEHHGMGIHIIGEGEGSTNFRIKLMHEGHADYTSKLISVTVGASMRAQSCSLTSCSCCPSNLYAAK